MSLVDALPRPSSPDALYDAFTAWASEQGLSLYPHQEEAAIELFSDNNVVLATPTGSGKSMVAVAAHFAALAAATAGRSTRRRSRRWCRRSSSRCARSSAPRTWGC